jgi:hypothetical protein
MGLMCTLGLTYATTEHFLNGKEHNVTCGNINNRKVGQNRSLHGV